MKVNQKTLQEKVLALSAKAISLNEEYQLEAYELLLKLIDEVEDLKQVLSWKDNRLAELEKMYENRTPTQWAYDRTREALNRKTEELARRDAATGEPVYQVQLDNDQWIDVSESVLVSQAKHGVKNRVLCTDARASALPPEMFMSDAVKANVTTDFMDGANWMREKVKELGCKAIKFGPSLNPVMFNSDVMFGYLKARKECAEIIRHQGFTVEGE